VAPFALVAPLTEESQAATEKTALPLPQAMLRLVDYVSAIGHMDPQKQRRRWPDVLRDLPQEGFTLLPGETRVLWLTVHIPAQALPGAYSSLITVQAANGESFCLPLRLIVHRPLIPNPSAWRLRVDFWQAFGRLAKAYRVAEWGEEWLGIVRIFLQDLAAHGQSVVQVGRGHFDWRKTASGQWQFGFERFDRYVELCASTGIEGLIEYLQMFNGRGETTLSFTEANGQTRQIKANPGEAAFDELWRAFARALAQHCEQKGWLHRLYICPTDEPQDVYGQPTLERFKHCRKLLREAHPGIRVTVALDSLQAARTLARDIDRFVFKLREDVYDPQFARELREQGKLVEAYICCHPDYPNSFITSEALEQRVLGWILWKEKLEGLLRWSYVNWPEDVWNKPEGDGRYAPGDLFIVYPGERQPLASTRWERLREGFEDFEMLRVIEELIRKSRRPESQRAEAEKLFQATLLEIAGPEGKLTAYTRDPNAFYAARQKLLEAADAP